MKSYTVLIIDEEIGQINIFAPLLEKNIKINVTALLPLPKEPIEDFMKRLEEITFDYLIIDFNLAEKIALSFDGEDVLEKLRKLYPFIPAMIFSGNRENAFNNTTLTDPLHICSKLEFSQNPSKFIENILKAIEVYNEKIKNWEKELKELLKKDKSGLSSLEYNRLNELDKNLEKTFGPSYTSIPFDLKTKGSEKQLTELLNTAQELLSELKND